MRESLAPRTTKTYASAWKSYTTFCITNDLLILPVSEQNLLYYFTHAAIRKISHRSLSVYLSALLHHARLNSAPFYVSEMDRLYMLLRGIRRTQGNSLVRIKRPPITFQHLSTLQFFFKICYPNRDGLMLWCACTMAFFGLLRSAEYTSPCASSFDDNTLKIDDVSFSHDRNKMFISLRLILF